jgi:hypothetical protein
MLASAALKKALRSLPRVSKKQAWYGDQHHQILSGGLAVATFNQQNLLEIYSANMASKEPVAKRAKLVFVAHDL